MQNTEQKDFDALLAQMCAGCGVPVGDKPGAYWKSLHPMSLIQFSRIVDFVLSEHGPDKLPTTKQCWAIYHRLRSPAPPGRVAIDTSQHSIQEQLCAYATSKLAHLASTPAFPRAWHYCYRQWVDADGKRNGECMGVVIELSEDRRLGFTVEQMVGDEDGYARALRSFEPGPRPTAQQIAAHRAALGRIAQGMRT